MASPSIDLTIHLTALDTDDLLREWRWRVPKDYTPIQMTKFGDWFFTDPREHVHMLDLIEGTLQEVAPSIAAYNDLKKTRPTSRTNGFSTVWSFAVPSRVFFSIRPSVTAGRFILCWGAN